MQTWDVQVQFVHVAPSPSWPSNYKFNNPNEWNIANVLLKTHTDAKKVLNMDLGNKKALLNEGSVVLVGLKEDNELPNTNNSSNRRGDHGGGGSIQDLRKPTSEWQIQQEQQHKQQQQQQEEWEAKQLKLQQEWQAQQLKQEQEWKLQQEAHDKRQSELSNLQNQQSTNTRKLELIHLQSSTLEQQLTLHKKMLNLIKDSQSKSQKLKEILKLTKQVHDCKKQRLELLSQETEYNQAMEDLIVEHKRQVALERSSNSSSSMKSPTRRTFRLDNRTRVLQVSGVVVGVGVSTDAAASTADDEHKQQVLNELKAHLMKFGQVTDLKWRHLNAVVPAAAAATATTTAPEQHQPTPTTSSSNPLVLVQCASRSDAEYIFKEAGTMGDTTLEFTWYHDDYSPRVVAVEGQGSEGHAGVVKENGEAASGQEESNKALEQNLYYAEDDDLMVDYDDEEEEEEV